MTTDACAICQKLTQAQEDVLAVNYLMREPVTEHEVERVLHALTLAGYQIEKRP